MKINLCVCVLQEVLDADDTPLRNRRGELMKRDIVQFVPFRELSSRSGANFSLVSCHVRHKLLFLSLSEGENL